MRTKVHVFRGLRTAGVHDGFFFFSFYVLRLFRFILYSRPLPAKETCLINQPHFSPMVNISFEHLMVKFFLLDRQNKDTVLASKIGPHSYFYTEIQKV